MFRFSLMYTRIQRCLLSSRLKSVLFSTAIMIYMILIAIVTIASWSTSLARELPMPDTQAQYTMDMPPTPPAPRKRRRSVMPASPARYNDPLVGSLAVPFALMDLGPGLRKMTSKRGKVVGWAEERNTMRYGTKWIGFDDDPFVEHFTEDVVLRSNDVGSTDEAVREYSVYWLDDDGDVIMDG